MSEACTDLALYVDGEWLAGGRSTHEVVNPATHGVLGEVPLATADDLDRAVQAAARAFPGWAGSDPGARAGVLHHAAALLRERAETVARLITLEEGKPLWESRGEVAFTADIVDFLAGEARHAYGTVVPTGAGARSLLVQEPIGPVAAFAPWNYPVIVPARKIAAALAAGCTLVIKCDEDTAGSAVALVRAFADAGVPAGVLNLVFGVPAEVSTRLIGAPQIRKVSFTGSTPVGKQIARLAAEGVKPLMLELGGHAPVLVFDDAFDTARGAPDLDTVAAAAVGNKFHNAGQSCGSSSRYYLHESVYEPFVARFAERASRLTVGNGLDDGVEMGPLSSPRRLAAIHALVEDAVGRGARVVTGGHELPGAGNYYAPTVLAEVPEDARIMTEEPFGPVAAMTSFRDEAEVLARANALPYGLGGYVFTSSARRALEVPRALEVGMVGLNKFDLGGADTYFGGRKESGYGSEGGPEAVRQFLVPKLILQG